ncbi:ATP phosphoribosyltransferase regulatory subunit [Enterovirga rhinocerotis]|uniref:ATP phosphoribosyltransferase regulatory subunit n=1 Tax=Enterovirga rhinocerotis TaxID=1339210 RepID=A0A4R7C8F2_9HYPH|nr:ATP phosphoribosyltransferase regulatory subunit [Enterovirga rhinocerotis]TDR94513.1 ATP phosphoribosyltransferase regulatory subunit [Enterovirga rhinocerotis]
MTTRDIAGEAGAALLDLFEKQGFRRMEPPVLQPAEIFIDLSGEDIRRRLYLTQDQQGRDLCLRPEYTIPVCRDHVASGRESAEYCYLGPVFRLRQEGSGEFLQVGFESIGGDDQCPADADALGLALDGYAAGWSTEYEVRLGDMGMLEAVFDALSIPANKRRRLARSLAAGKGAAAIGSKPTRQDATAYSGLLAAIEGQDPKAARAFVEDVISIAGLSQIGGRTAAEIADRFLAQAENGSGEVSDRARSVLRRYLAIRGDLDDSADAIRALARDEGLDLSVALDRFEDRTGFIAARGIDLSRLLFAADFARGLDYYTGFIFELREAGSAEGSYVAAGGRYDRLFEHLGPGRAIPAIGCSFWLDRFAGA